MTKRQVNTNLLLHGTVYYENEYVEVTDADALALERFLVPLHSNTNNTNEKVKQTDEVEVEETKNNTQDKSVDYSTLKISELRKLVEEKGLNVTPTGKTGAIKQDYVDALENAERG